MSIVLCNSLLRITIWLSFLYTHSGQIKNKVVFLSNNEGVGVKVLSLTPRDRNLFVT